MMARIKHEFSSRLPRDITLVRPTSDTYYDGTGVQRTAGVDVPRFGYQQITLKSLGLYVGPSDSVMYVNADQLEGEHTIEIHFHIPTNRSADSYILHFTNDDDSDHFDFLYNASKKWQLLVRSNGVLVADIQSAIKNDIIGYHRAAILLSPNNHRLYIDGELVGSDDTGAAPGHYTLGCLGQSGDLDKRLDGSVLRINVWPPRPHEHMLRMVSNVPIDPTHITAHIGRYDVGLSTLTTDVGVDSMSDLSNESNHATQSSGSAQPILVLNQHNGLPILRFDGTDDYMIADGAASYFAGEDTPFSIFMVAKLNVVVNGDRLWGTGHSVNVEPHMSGNVRFDTDSIRFRRRDDGNTNVNVDDGVAPETSNFHIFGWVFHGQTVDIYRDNVKVVDGAAINVGALTTDFFTIGAHRRASISSFGAFDFGAMDIFDRVLTAEEIAGELLTINARWAIY